MGYKSGPGSDLLSEVLLMTQPDILEISLITWRTCAHIISTPATHQLRLSRM